MSDFEPNDGSGFLFKNTKKTNDKAPDYRGNVKVNGVCFDLAGWVNESKSGNGNKYIGLKISNHWAKPCDGGNAPANTTPPTPKEPDMPF